MQDCPFFLEVFDHHGDRHKSTCSPKYWDLDYDKQQINNNMFNNKMKTIHNYKATPPLPPPTDFRCCSMLSQSSLVRQNIIAWSMSCLSMAFSRYSALSFLTASDSASNKSENSQHLRHFPTNHPLTDHTHIGQN